MALTGTENLDAMAVAVRYHRYLLDAALPWLRRVGAGRVIDFGAGIGTYSELLRDLGFDVTAAEPDDAARAAAAAAGLDVVADSADLPDDVADAVISFNVIEHVDDHVGLVAEMGRLARAGGAVVLIVPARMELWTPMDDVVGHLRRYDRAMLERTIVQAGLRPHALRYLDLPGALVTLAYRALPTSSGRLSTRSTRLFDRVVVPVSRAADTLRVPFGKNLIAVALPPGSPGRRGREAG